jgi:hypothetical protein
VKTRGRRHTYSEKLLLAQVGREFSKIREKVGAREAASLLRISLASFYNYAAGSDLPRTETLHAASKLWNMKWIFIDGSEVLRTKNAQSAEQYAFSFLSSLREDDVEITEIKPSQAGALRLTINISIPALQNTEKTRKDKR